LPAPTPPGSRFDQSTVRHAPPPPPPVSSGSRTNTRRETSDEYDDYDDGYDTYPSRVPPARQASPPPSIDDLPDTTMLDSVVLPAIASVSVPDACQFL
jgi:serine/threonine-protein kinase 24/25/MST4